MATIKGYRSAISHVLRVHGLVLSLVENLGEGVVRSFEIRRPVIQSLICVTSERLRTNRFLMLLLKLFRFIRFFY